MDARTPTQIAKEIEAIQALVAAGGLSEAAGQAAIQQLTVELLAAATAPSPVAPSQAMGVKAGGHSAGSHQVGTPESVRGADGGSPGANAGDTPTVRAACAPVVRVPTARAPETPRAGVESTARAVPAAVVDQWMRAERADIDRLREGVPGGTGASPRPASEPPPPLREPVAGSAAPGGPELKVSTATVDPAAGAQVGVKREGPPNRGSHLAVRLALAIPLVGCAWVAGIVATSCTELVLGDTELAAFLTYGWFYASAVLGLGLVWRFARHEKVLPSQRLVAWTMLVFLGMGGVGTASRLMQRARADGAPAAIAPRPLTDAEQAERAEKVIAEIRAERIAEEEAAAATARPRCLPQYAGACVPAPPPDLDCKDIGHPIAVLGDDVHRLDRDGNGRACEGQ